MRNHRQEKYLDIMRKEIRIPTKEAYFGQILTVVDSLCSMLAAGDTRPAALSAYLAYSASFSDSRHSSKRCTCRFQGDHHATGQNTRRVSRI